MTSVAAELLFTSIVLSTAIAAAAPPPAPVAYEDARRPALAVPGPLDGVPRSTALVAFSPRLAAGIELLLEEAEALGLPPLGGPLALDPFFGTAERSEARVPHLVRLEELGLAADGPALVGLEPSGVWVMVLPLADPQRFRHFLSDRTTTRFVPVGPERAIVGGAADRPVACVVRSARATCQLGLEPAEALAPLHRWLGFAGPGAPRPTPSPTAPWSIHVSPQPAGELLRRVALEALEADLRFVAAEERRTELERRARALAALRPERWVTELVGSLTRGERGLEAHLRLGLTRAGRGALDPVRARDPDARVLGFAAGPALAKLFVQAPPAWMEALAAKLGLPLGADALGGSLAILAVGVDPACAAAKRPGALTELARWPSLVPTLIAAELAPAVTPAFGPPWRVHGDDEGARRYLGEWSGNEVSLEVLPGALLLGTGAGGGGAARRRWRSAPVASSLPSGTLVAAELDLAAVEATLRSLDVPPDVVPRGAFEDLERRLRIAAARFRHLSALARAPGDTHVELELRASR